MSGCASTCNDHSLQVENSALADYARSITDRFVRGDTVPLNKGSTVINNKTNNDNDDIFESWSKYFHNWHFLRLRQQENLAKFPHSPILHYAYSPLLKENNSANNRLPLGLFALFSRSWIFSKSFFKPSKNRRFWTKNSAFRISFQVGFDFSAWKTTFLKRLREWNIALLLSPHESQRLSCKCKILSRIENDAK